MPFDPNLPQANTEIDAVQMRSQLNGLKELIDAVSAINNAVIDNVVTVPGGDPAFVTVSVVGDTLHFSFGLERGDTGPEGPVGPPGEVSQATLNAAIGNTAVNPSGVSPLNVNYQDPVSAGDLNQVKDKVNELIAALVRMP